MATFDPLYQGLQEQDTAAGIYRADLKAEWIHPRICNWQPRLLNISPHFATHN